MAKIVHHRKNCIGCGSCVEHASCYWAMSRFDGKADLKSAQNKNGVYVTDISEAEMEENIKAAKDCPVQIIKVYDDKGTEVSK